MHTNTAQSMGILGYSENPYKMGLQGITSLFGFWDWVVYTNNCNQ